MAKFWDTCTKWTPRIVRAVLVVAVCLIAYKLFYNPTNAVVTQPGTVTLENALAELGSGIKKMYENRGDLDTGLYPSEVEVTFNITASQTNDGKLHVEITKTVDASPAKGELNSGTIQTGSRGNTVSVKFTHILFAKPGTLLYDKSAGDIAEKWAVIRPVTQSFEATQPSTASSTATKPSTSQPSQSTSGGTSIGGSDDDPLKYYRHGIWPIR